MNDCNPIPCDCVDGPQGPQGLNGPKGNTGAPGSDGIVGDVGVQGDLGDQGELGETGIQGDPGATTIGLDGDQGPQGPNGNQGVQGIPGLDDTGTDGTDGTDVAGWWNYQSSIGPCDIYIPNPGAPVPEELSCCSVGGSMPPSSCLIGANKCFFLHQEGLGYQYMIFPAAVLGDTIKIVGTLNASSFFIRTSAANGTAELAAYNSYTNNISTIGGVTLPSTWRGVDFGSNNGSDCIELLYIEDDRWVIIKANFANGVTPTFT